MKTEYYLHYMQLGISPTISGPFKTEYDMQTELLSLMLHHNDLLYADGSGVVTELRIISGRPHVYTFSGGYMDNIREVATATYERRAPQVDPNFPLISKPRPTPKPKSKARLILLWLFLSVGSAFGMTRLEALSQIESGNNDYAVGRHGEVSRYQILPSVWRRHTNQSPQDSKVAAEVVRELMSKRCTAFHKQFGTPPNDFQYYVLYNAPAHIQKPSSVVAERAQRFANLMQTK